MKPRALAFLLAIPLLACGGDPDAASGVDPRWSPDADLDRADAGPPPPGMVAIAGGSFALGCTVADDPDCSTFLPPRTVSLADFAIDRDEVTVGAARACLAEPGCNEYVIQSPTGDDDDPVERVSVDWCYFSRSFTWCFSFRSTSLSGIERAHAELSRAAPSSRAPGPDGG